jgi:hypothetical protein
VSPVQVSIILSVKLLVFSALILLVPNVVRCSFEQNCDFMSEMFVVLSTSNRTYGVLIPQATFWRMPNIGG